MVTMFVTHAGDTGTAFDRDHWINVHLPLVREAWGPHGLLSAAGFFPSGDGCGLIAICPVGGGLDAWVKTCSFLKERTKELPRFLPAGWLTSQTLQKKSFCFFFFRKRRFLACA